MITVAVTGTNGKTSTCSFLHQLGMHLGLRTASATSVGFTTPSDLAFDPAADVDFDASLQRLEDGGVELLVVETVSIALADGRMGDFTCDAAAILDVTADHLERHNGFDAYIAAKRSLLDRIVPGGAAVISTKMLNAQETVERAEQLDIAVRRVGPGEEWGVIDGLDGGPLTLVLGGEAHEVETSLAPGFLRANLPGALALADAALGRRDELVKAIGALVPPPGRMETVGMLNGGRVIVDNSHNPAGLHAALMSARALSTGRVLVVVGAGGERDRGKRPEMGRVAYSYADVAIITDDNPRRENAAAIRAAILEGCPTGVEIADRAEAIWAAMEQLRSGDVLVVAGRGTETHIDGPNGKTVLNDAAVVRAGITAVLDASSDAHTS